MKHYEFSQLLHDHILMRIFMTFIGGGGGGGGGQ